MAKIGPRLKRTAVNIINNDNGRPKNTLVRTISLLILRVRRKSVISSSRNVNRKKINSEISGRWFEKIVKNRIAERWPSRETLSRWRSSANCTWSFLDENVRVEVIVLERVGRVFSVSVVFRHDRLRLLRVAVSFKIESLFWGCLY